MDGTALHVLGKAGWLDACLHAMDCGYTMAMNYLKHFAFAETCGNCMLHVLRLTYTPSFHVQRYIHSP